MAPSVTRKRVILALVLAGSLAGAAVALPALAAPSKKLYTASMGTPPVNGPAGASKSYTFRITNSPTSSQAPADA